VYFLSRKKMNYQSLVIQNREEILRIAERHGAYNVRLFGSAARGDDNTQSDIDFLVNMYPGRSLLDMGGLFYDLRELLNVDVDVVTENGLKPRIRKTVLKEDVAL
jgi:predicted nucleotidyltransferase